jgi:oxygen-independent coproporphyrinogen-3 oxidase
VGHCSGTSFSAKFGERRCDLYEQVNLNRWLRRQVRKQNVESGIIKTVALGVYISVPFCRTKCSYCNFASDVFSRAVFERYVDRVCGDIASAPPTAEEMGWQIEHEVDSIYLGGGTPTVLDPMQLQRIFAAVRDQFSVSSNAEVTVECAPGTLRPEVLERLVRCGVNRVSLGVQSFVDAEAASVGRLHKRSTVLDDIANLRAAGIPNINIDLIAGLPHQTAETWQESIAEALATGAPHVSVYMLEVDEDSRLGREVIAGGTRYHAHFVPDDEATADFYVAACEQLEAAGIAQYEISNFARVGSESRHNLKYWTRQPYLGFGVDAHSMLPSPPEKHTDATGEGSLGEGHDLSRADSMQNTDQGFSLCGDGVDAVRFSAPDALEKYVAGSPLQKTIVSRRGALEERFFLGLRLNRGVDLREIAAHFGQEEIDNLRPAISELIADGLLQRDRDSIRLTPRGRLLSNEVFQAFLAPGLSTKA